MGGVVEGGLKTQPASPPTLPMRDKTRIDKLGLWTGLIFKNSHKNTRPVANLYVRVCVCMYIVYAVELFNRSLKWSHCLII